MDSSPARGAGEGLGLVATLLAVLALLTAFRYAPWLLAAALLALLITVLIPRGSAGRGAVCALVAAAITAPLAALAIIHDYQHTTTRLQAAPARPAAHAARGRRAPGSRDVSREASRRNPRAVRRVTVHGGFLAAWNPTHGLLGPFRPAALTRWWALTASVTISLTALLTALLLGWLAVHARGRPPVGRHASWPQIGHSSRTWRPS